jgi:hypothetical protein
MAFHLWGAFSKLHINDAPQDRFPYERTEAEGKNPWRHAQMYRFICSSKEERTGGMQPRLQRSQRSNGSVQRSALAAHIIRAKRLRSSGRSDSRVYRPDPNLGLAQSRLKLSFSTAALLTVYLP